MTDLTTQRPAGRGPLTARIVTSII